MRGMPTDVSRGSGRWLSFDEQGRVHAKERHETRLRNDSEGVGHSSLRRKRTEHERPALDWASALTALRRIDDPTDTLVTRSSGDLARVADDSPGKVEFRRCLRGRTDAAHGTLHRICNACIFDWRREFETEVVRPALPHRERPRHLRTDRRRHACPELEPVHPVIGVTSPACRCTHQRDDGTEHHRVCTDPSARDHESLLSS